MGFIADAIRQLNPRSPLAAEEAAIGKAAQRHNVDWRLIVAVAQAETSLGTTGNALSLHNAWGLGPHRSYPSWEAGADAFGQTIARYRADGLTSVAKIQTRYAPSRASNDPTGLNSNWTRNVTSTLVRLGGDPNDVRQSRAGGQVVIDGDVLDAAKDGVGTVAEGVAGAVVNPIADLVALVARLFDPALWRRVLAAVGGLVLLVLALVMFWRSR